MVSIEDHEAMASHARVHIDGTLKCDPAVAQAHCDSHQKSDSSTVVIESVGDSGVTCKEKGSEHPASKGENVIFFSFIFSTRITSDSPGT